MTWVAIGTTVVGLVGTAVNNNQAKKAAQGANKAGTINVDEIITKARDAAAENYRRSFELEASSRPGTANLRSQTDTLLGDLAGGKTPGMSARNRLLEGIVNDDNALVNESADSILQSLREGASLPADVQNQIVRSALQRGGAAGVTGSGAGRGLVARDIGTTSLALQRARQQDALNAGNLLEQLGLARFGAVQGAAQADASNAALLAGIIDSRPLPEAGLSAGSIADLYIGNTNAAGQRAANLAAIDARGRNENLNALLGLGSTVASAYAKYKKPGTGGGTIDTTTTNIPGSDDNIYN